MVIPRFWGHHHCHSVPPRRRRTSAAARPPRRGRSLPPRAAASCLGHTTHARNHPQDPLEENLSRAITFHKGAKCWKTRERWYEEVWCAGPQAVQIGSGRNVRVEEYGKLFVKNSADAAKKTHSILRLRHKIFSKHSCWIMQSNIKTPEHKGAATREKSQTFSNQRVTRLQSTKAPNHSKLDKILGNSSIDAAIRLGKASNRCSKHQSRARIDECNLTQGFNKPPNSRAPLHNDIIKTPCPSSSIAPEDVSLRGCAWGWVNVRLRGSEVGGCEVEIGVFNLTLGQCEEWMCYFFKDRRLSECEVWSDCEVEWVRFLF